MLSKNKEFVPSKYQTDIFNYIKDPTEKHLVVQAVAGSGKSTTLVESIKHVPSHQRIIFLAFNKRNTEELKPKMTPNAEASTLNSVGHRAWARHIGSFLQLESKKTYNLIDEIFPNGGLPTDIKIELIEAFRTAHGEEKLAKYSAALDRNLKDAVYDLSRLVALAKGSGLVPNISKAKHNYNSLMEDTHENWIGIIDSQNLDIDRPEVAIALARRVLDRTIATSDEVLDFDDQLYLPVIFRVKFNQFDWVYVDELQDLNAIQHAMVEMLVKPNGRVVGVGDERQSIYKFRGSVSNSMNVFKSKFAAKELPLSVSYRCGKKIIEAAKLIVPHIEWHEDKHDGEVVNMETYGPKVFGAADAVICRNTRPLVSLAYKLIRAGVSCRILGKDIEHGLVALAKKMKASSVEELRDKLTAYEKRECERFAKKKQDERAQSLRDRIETLMVFINEMKEGVNRTPQKLYESINKIFRMDELNQKRMLVFSTGHKSKGGEWDTVFFLDPQLIPSKWARDAESLLQENNLKYIITTRAIRKLVYITSDGYIDTDKKKLDNHATGMVE